jgi:hypothetical protein
MCSIIASHNGVTNPSSKRRYLVEELLEQATQLKRRPLAVLRQQRRGGIGRTIDAPAGDRRRGALATRDKRYGPRWNLADRSECTGHPQRVLRGRGRGTGSRETCPKVWA